MNATTKTKSVGCWLLTWGEINAEQHCDQLSFEPEDDSYTGWIYHPRFLTVPDGWHIGMSGGGSLELYDETDLHQQFVRVARHGKSAEFASATGVRWLPLREAENGEAVCCPTCGK